MRVHIIYNNLHILRVYNETEKRIRLKWNRSHLFAYIIILSPSGRLSLYTSHCPQKKKKNVWMTKVIYVYFILY